MDNGSIHLNLTAPVMPGLSGSSEVLAENRDLIRAVKALNATELFGQDNELTFVLDRETRRPLVRIVNRETKEVIRQIPPEYILRMAEDMKPRR